MPILSSIGKGLREVDLFPTSSFLRYSGGSEYTTSSGGLTSVIIIGVLIALFASMGLRTVKRQIINSSFSSQNEQEPSALALNMSPDGGFMFMLGMPGYDVTNSSYKVFNITLFQEYYSPVLQLINRTAVNMEPCTIQHFNFSEQIIALYYKLNMSRMLCPPLNQEMHLMGKKTSDIFAQFKVSVEYCNKTIDPGCVTAAQFANLTGSMSQFSVAVPFINTKVNPGKSSYKESYLQDRNYASFTTSFGASVYVGIQEDIVETDNSLTPLEDKVTENVTTVPRLFQLIHYMTSGKKPYIQIIFNKEPTCTTFVRSFNKVDTYFSYVGGLIGTIIGLIFVLGQYTEKAYEISIARKLFLNNDQEEIPSSSYNMGYFLTTCFVKILSFCKCDMNWKKTKMFEECTQEIQMQLDVTYLLRKLMFLEAAVSKLVEPHELEAIYMRKKMTLDRAKKQRKMHFAPEMFKQKLRKGKTEDQSQTKSYFERDDIDQDIVQTQKCQTKSDMKSEDISALQFSQISEDFNRVKRSVSKVARQSIKGRRISRRIMTDLNQKILQQLKIDEGSLQQVDVRPTSDVKSSGGQKYEVIYQNLQNQYDI